MSARQLTVGGPSVAAGEWTRAHRALVGFVAFVTLGLLILTVDVRKWRGVHSVKTWQFDDVLFPCQVRQPRAADVL